MKTAVTGIKLRIFSFLLYGGLGITTEVIFTAVVDLAASGTWDDLSLKGYSYVWMLPIYGSASVLFPIGYNLIEKRPRLLRYLFYGAVILLVELITGFLLEQITGSCPWEYREGWHFSGYIRLDYLPLWMAFGAMIEQFHRFIRKVGIA